MSAYAQNVAEALIKADPEGKVYYQQRLGNYQMQLKNCTATHKPHLTPSLPPNAKS